MIVQLRFSSAIAFFYKVIVIFWVLESLEGDSAVCVYCYCPLDIIDM